ncbi:RES domain-containing protein [Cryobacterium sp. TMS1-20-1]|uniref:RES domain-containing protein n=1 Tax=Cryobacterium sp. Hh7 TaxID=1259159 RepID=UPI00106AF3E6|nr:RES domain-containing protein [Cryobacterium sp. Hh7]TFC77238.1 RES domain-containing protein [Cryobacterium sp. TMS1-20-1]TFD51868.1 RES domain-containing protein [Cryobacterium sp. Hh7]
MIVGVPELELVLSVNPGTVWRVGFRPDPWSWSDWKHATDAGRFNGRWDDINGQFRTVYAGQSLLACLIEVFAKYRCDPHLGVTLEDIVEDPADAIEFPARAPAAVSYRWLEDRCASRATLQGTFCAVAAAGTIASLWPRFIDIAHRYGAVDFDASAMKNSLPRDLTRTIASWLYQQTEPSVDGIEFASRHGDDLKLWAIFERPSAESNSSPLLSAVTAIDLAPETPELVAAFATLGLTWTN